MLQTSLDSVTWREAAGIDYMTWPVFDALGVEVVMTTRFGGVSRGDYQSLNMGLHVGDAAAAVIENRTRAARAIGAELGDLVFANQTHGRNVAVVTEADRGRGTTSLAGAVASTDAFVTADPGPVLAMMVADCVPIALYDPRAHVAAVVHSGWRGTVGRVAKAALEAMADLGATPGDVIAAVGPAVDPATYQVGPEVMEAAAECFAGDTDDVLRPCRELGGASGTYLFDLWEANRRILVESGVSPGNVHLSGVPTGGEGPFFSDRVARPCGRNAILVRLRRR